MRWTAPGHESALETLVALLRATAWPGPPEGFRPILPPRPMRTVLEGTLAGPGGQARVVVKWNQPDTLADRVSRRVRGGKGVREGVVLRALRDADVAVPEPLAFTDEGADVLVTVHVPDLAALPAAEDVQRPLLEALAGQIARAHAAGLRHRDLHAGNVALRAGAPLLVDLGSARIGGPFSAAERTRELAALAHGLLGGARRTQRLRALRLYMRQVHGAGGPAEARAWARPLEQELLRVRRAFHRGRDRRATRSGKHFELFRTPGGAAGVRNRDSTDASWIARIEPWLEAAPEDTLALKAGGGVVRKDALVLKRYEGVASGRLPRPIRAFRMAYGLRNRGIRAPQPHLAVAEASGAGLYVAKWIDAPNLHDFLASGAYAALPRAQQRRLLDSLGRTVRLMHDAEVTHRDLKAPNVLVGAALDVVLADLDGARIRRRPVRWARRERDLMRLDASLDLSERDRARILTSYHSVLPIPPIPLAEFATNVARLAQRKRGPSGAPR